MGTEFTPVPALAGGLLIGSGAALLLIATGHPAGISGVVDEALQRRAPAWSVAFLAGLVAAGLAVHARAPEMLPGLKAGTLALAVSGVLVGLGTRISGGCTSGHGIVGMSRLSRRSIVATLTFIALGMATVALRKALLHA